MKNETKIICSVVWFCGVVICALLSLTAVSLLLYGCGALVPGETGNSGTDIRVVSWNVQTFFDAQTAGTEYGEFRGPNTAWSLAKYTARLERLCGAIKRLDADILVLQEIENESVLRDIVNFLASDNTYRYVCFAADGDEAIGCGVLSRLPVVSGTVHQVDSRIHGVQPSLRPLLEITVSNTADVPVCVLLICHWKSKAGGSDAAAVWQAAQERLAAIRAAELLYAVLPADENRLPVVLCGDFNRDIGEFTEDGADGRAVCMDGVSLKSGWLSFSSADTGEGSYFYRNNWEKIDHFFIAGAIDFVDFKAESDGPWSRLSDTGVLVPFRYELWNGQGYSDHFPIAATFRISGRQKQNGSH